MGLLPILLLALAVVAPIHAFTNGSLVPEYFCHPDAHGMPQALGELLPFLVEDRCDPIAFNSQPTMNLQVPPLTNSTPGNAAYVIASFHNTLNKITPIVQGMIVTTVDGGPLIAGQPNRLNLSSGDPNVALDGAMLYAKTPEIKRVGNFSDPSGTFKAFPGCGRNGQGQYAGVIHQQIITCNSSYTGLSYTPPKCDVGNITLAGLDVTDNGFGIWNVTMQVEGATTDADDCTDSAWQPWSV